MTRTKHIIVGSLPHVGMSRVLKPTSYVVIFSILILSSDFDDSCYQYHRRTSIIEKTNSKMNHFCAINVQEQLDVIQLRN